MEDEITNFITVWLIVIACLTSSYFISSRIPKGNVRLLSVIPVILVFVFLPLMFSSFLLQFYLGSCIGCLSNFKLLLFAFGRDDTFSTNPSISLLEFIVIITFPIKLKENSFRNRENNKMTSLSQDTKRTLSFAINLLIWCISIQMYVNHKQQKLIAIPFILPLLYTFRMFCGPQVQFVFAANFAKLWLRKDIEPQFRYPLVSTSLQDFWGRRWNRSFSDVLRTSIHEPTRSLLTPFLGRRWALYPAILATFLVSGLMHEFIYLYVCHRWPTWEVMWFFIIHGVCVSIEVELKKRASKNGWKVSPIISMPLTLVFLVTTASWLCYTELIEARADQREVEEYADFLQYAKNTYKSFITSSKS